MHHPRLRVLPLFLLPLATVPLTSQETQRQVPPGREVRDQKLLSFGTTDAWTLHVEKDEMLWCTVEGNEFDPVLQFFDAQKQKVAENDGAGTHSELWLRAAAKGDVEFHVRSAGGVGGGHYSFWLQRYQTEPLAIGGEATHTFGPEQWWHYRVHLHQGDMLVPSLQNGSLTAVFDAERVGVADVMGSNLAPHDGDYLLRVEGPEHTTCRLQLGLVRQRDLPADGVSDALTAFGFDLWRLHLRAGTAYVLDVTMQDATPFWDLREQPPGAPPEQGPAFVWTGALDKGGRALRWLQARRDCKLELRLRTNGLVATRYRLALAAPTAELQAGTPVTAKLALGGGDLYRLPAQAGEQLRIALASTAFDARFDVQDPDGNVIAPGVDDAGPLDRNAVHRFLVTRPGAYHVLVYTAGGAGSGDYELRADAEPVPEVQLGGRLAVQVQQGGTSYVHLSLQEGQEVWLAVRSSAFDAALTVVDPVGDSGFHCEGGGVGGDVLVAYRASHTGVHTLLVQSRRDSGAGEVRVVKP
jgi:hypothetical protein